MDVLKENMSNILGSEWVGEANEVGKLQEPVNYNQNCIFVIRFGKAFHEIHRYVTPWFVWYG